MSIPMCGCMMHVLQYTTRNAMYTTILLLPLCLTQHAPIEKQEPLHGMIHTFVLIHA